MALTQSDVTQIIDEINDGDEEGRRALMKRRSDIYRDGGKKFLLEQMSREFGAESIQQMRLAPINILKKIVNKKAVYKKPPTRTATNEVDQKLIDHYTEDLSFDQTMLKANIYWDLFANTAIYTVPTPDGKIKTMILPPYLYSVVPKDTNPTEPAVWVLNQFVESGRITPLDDVPSATGTQGFQRQKGSKTTNDKVDSQEDAAEQTRNYIFWTDQDHFTTDDSGNMVLMSEGEQSTLNPIEMSPLVNLAKDRDDTFWATQGEDLVDMCIALQIGFSDLLTIAKHQGFSTPVIIAEEKPEMISVGINKGIFLQIQRDGATPSFDYIAPQSPLNEYANVLMELLAMTLSTNDMNPGTISGQLKSQAAMSGISQMVAMSDTLEAQESAKPQLRDTEKEVWMRIAAWHNYLVDSGLIHEDAKALGKFSDQFGVAVAYPDARPLESESDRIKNIKELQGLGLIDQESSLRKLHPDLTDKQIEEKLKSIETQRATRLKSSLSFIDGGRDDGREG